MPPIMPSTAPSTFFLPLVLLSLVGLLTAAPIPPVFSSAPTLSPNDDDHLQQHHGEHRFLAQLHREYESFQQDIEPKLQQQLAQAAADRDRAIADADERLAQWLAELDEMEQQKRKDIREGEVAIAHLELEEREIRSALAYFGTGMGG